MRTEIDWDKVNKKLRKVEDRLGDNLIGNMTCEEFSDIINNLLISKDGYVIATGNIDNVNYVVANSLIDKIKKHPILWKLFFMIA